ncbi:MAG: hypothetical protein K9H49_11565 [Bacteroidales bacterium]|nr:hypothetical protein [Bacteroidales bacterium]
MQKLVSNLLLLALLFLFSCSGTQPKADKTEDRLPTIYPDYSSIIIPVNIAPLNFIIQENATDYFLRIKGNKGDELSLKTSNGKVDIPLKKWKALLHDNIGDSIEIQVFARQAKQWIRYKSIRNFVSSDSIDSHIVYREINPALKLWTHMGIIQRSTETFEESIVIQNKNTDNNCMHCHAFQANKPDNMMLHFRTPPGGTLIYSDGKSSWLNTKTPYSLASFAYPAWHPTKNYIAFSTNKINQLMYSSGDRLNYVYDDASDIVVYDIDKNQAFTSDKISGEGLGNLPNWSPKGDYLYYISCPKSRKDKLGLRITYDLMRIAINADTREWGNAELLISADSVGKSISFPEVAPNGKYVIFCMADYGYFTIGNTSSDLYIYDIEGRTFRKLHINSNETESFHSWSHNSRWLVFATKRDDGIVSLPYITHIDEQGNESKPFILPVKDPEAHLTGLFNYNRPVFVNGKIMLSEEAIVEIIKSETRQVGFDTTNITVMPDFDTNTVEDESTSYEKN